MFLLLDTAATAVGTELRGTTALAWRGMAPRSHKDPGFFGARATTSYAVVLCESAIDALSCHALNPAYRCLSTSGARPDPAWLTELMAQGLPIYCGFDADSTGDTMAQSMQDLHPSVRRLRPATKDWNDLLRQLAPYSPGQLTDFSELEHSCLERESAARSVRWLTAGEHTRVNFHEPQRLSRAILRKASSRLGFRWH